MNNSIPENLQARHLQFGLAPEQKTDSAGELAGYYTTVLARIDRRLHIADLLQERIRELAEPEQEADLGELVQAARKRLRQERLQADVDELRARRYVINTIRGAIVP